MHAKLLKLIDSLTRNFWFLPGLMMAASIGLYAITVAFNDSAWVATLQHYDVVYAGSLSGAQQIVSVIAQTMVAIASLVFAAVVVVLTLATSQFGHRLIRSFMRDKSLQYGLGIFVATFVYCLLVLHTMHGAGTRVPSLSVSVAFYLAIIAGATLIYLTHHIAQMIAAPSIISEVGVEMEATIDRAYPEKPETKPLEPETIEAALRRLERDGVEVASNARGYIQTLDTSGLIELACEHDLVIEFRSRPGDYLFDGSLVAKVVSPGRLGTELEGRIRRSMTIGNRRTPVQDLRFAFNQLAEIAVRAMSPALNDPFTALDCVNRIGDGIARLAQRSEPSPYHADSQGRLRLIIKPVRFAELIDGVFTPVRNYSRQSVIVTLQMLRAIEELAPLLRGDSARRALAEQAVLIRRGAEEALPDVHDYAAVQEIYARALEKLGLDESDLPLE
ncbi:MAG: DUF2254 domain-containing protein [Gammaproteobacteria bacterium]